MGRLPCMLVPTEARVPASEALCETNLLLIQPQCFPAGQLGPVPSSPRPTLVGRRTRGRMEQAHSGAWGQGLPTTRVWPTEEWTRVDQTRSLVSSIPKPGWGPHCPQPSPLRKPGSTVSAAGSSGLRSCLPRPAPSFWVQPGSLSSGQAEALGHGSRRILMEQTGPPGPRAP